MDIVLCFGIFGYVMFGVVYWLLFLNMLGFVGWLLFGGLTAWGFACRVVGGLGANRSLFRARSCWGGGVTIVPLLGG